MRYLQRDCLVGSDQVLDAFAALRFAAPRSGVQRSGAPAREAV
jgi:hypothetical protein